MLQRLPIGIAAMLLSQGALLPDIVRAEEDRTRDVAVDERLNMFAEPWRVWLLPVRYKAAYSQYFRPGPPPYRQQVEDALKTSPEDQTVDPAPADTSPPPPSTSDSGSSGDDGGSDSNGGDDNGGGNGDNGGGDGGGPVDIVPQFDIVPEF